MPRRPARTKPAPTAEEASNRTIRLIVFVITIQFYLSGLDQVFGGVWMLVIWFAVGTTVAVATYQIERYFDRRRRLLE